jgi:transposase-like protein
MAKYTPEKKAKIIEKAKELHTAGKTWDEVATACGVARLTIYNWLKAAGVVKAAKKAKRNGTNGAKRGRPAKQAASVDEISAAVMNTKAFKKMVLVGMRDFIDSRIAKL